MRENKRAGLLDEVRGFAIICMVVYHVMFDLKYLFGVDVPIFFDTWFDTVRDIFAGTFIFISGIVCRYSRNNIKRGAQCFFLGMVITFTVAFVSPGSPVLFGILHFMGISMIIYGLGERLWDILPAVIGIAVSVLFFIMTVNVRADAYLLNGEYVIKSVGYIGIGSFSFSIPAAVYDARLLFPLGFTYDSFGDFFPLLPWLFLFFAGAYFGVYVKENRCPDFFYRTRVKFLAAAGRYTIWIYMLHQPIAFLILSLIFK